MNFKHIAIGLACYVPGVYNFLSHLIDQPASARYGYAVWMRHLVRAHQRGVAEFPCVVAELGPGYSLGAGMAALLSGAEQYYAVDVVGYAGNKKNLKLFDELVELFQARADIPDAAEFPHLKPALDSYAFPKDLLSDAHLAQTLDEQRVADLRASVLKTDAPDSPMRYVFPWTDASILEKDSLDMIFSQAVLEHVDELEAAYRALANWLKPTGFMTHTIDFKCHNTAKKWNGHWAIADWQWRLMRGGRPYLLNRQPHSAHLRLLHESGFRIRLDQRFFSKEGIDRKDLTARFQHLTDEDLKTQGAFILSVPHQHE